MNGIFEQVVQIKATPEDVFDHFVDPAKLVTWMGDFARLEAQENGLFSVDINGVLIRGHYITLDRPNLIEVTWGEAGNDDMPPGSTTLTVRLKAKYSGTELTLAHSGLIPSEAEKHAVGWPHFLDRLAAVSSGAVPTPDPWSV